MKRLYLVRHAPADWPESEPCYRGWSDAGLSVRGRREAASLAGRFAHEGLDAVYSSDLRRARQTADGIADALGLRTKIVEGLREMNFGDWEGRSHAELSGGGHYDRWVADFFNVSPPGGESFGDFVRRVRVGMTEILRCEPDRASVAVVGHGGSLRVVMCDLLGMPEGNHWRIRQDHSSVTLFEWAGEIPVLHYLNDLSHLGAAT